MSDDNRSRICSNIIHVVFARRTRRAVGGARDVVRMDTGVVVPRTHNGDANAQIVCIAVGFGMHGEAEFISAFAESCPTNSRLKL